MQTKTILAALALAGTTLAANLQPRQTDLSAVSQCMDLIKTLPTPPPALTNEWMTNPPKDYCSVSIPASLSKDWSSYTSSASSWFKAHSSDLTKCPGADKVTQQPIDCKAGSGTKTTAAAQDSSSSTGATGTAASASHSTKTGAAPRETGMAFAAVAAAGFALAAL